MSEFPNKWGKTWSKAQELARYAKKRTHKPKPKPAVRGLRQPDFGALNEVFGIPRT